MAKINDRLREGISGRGTLKDAQQSKVVLYKDSEAGIRRVQNSWARLEVLAMEKRKMLLPTGLERRKDRPIRRHRIKGGNQGSRGVWSQRVLCLNPSSPLNFCIITGKLPKLSNP